MSIVDRFRRSSVQATEGDALRGRVFRPAPHVVWTTLRGETVVFDVDRGKYESLNEVATSVWERLINGASLERITDAIQEEYELRSPADIDQMIMDVTALLVKLSQAKVIVATAAS